MDDLGQGIDRSGEAPLFVAKTLPGEQGQVTPHRQAKGVSFARLQDPQHLQKRAPNRVEPDCPHYQQCPGCHYLHTDYASEQDYKQQSFARCLRGLKSHSKTLPEVQWIRADERLHYRNRIQLHYRHKYLGLMDPVDNRVTAIPQCQLIAPALQPALTALYDRFEGTPPEGDPNSKQGHVELYLQADGDIKESWNQAYAAGGFTQVNSAMHQTLLDCLESTLRELVAKGFKPDSVLDCFAGDGNLSDIAGDVWPGIERSCVDRYPQGDDSTFLSLDLYDEQALTRYLARAPRRHSELMIVDPPRGGFPQLSRWVDKTKAHYLIYIACDARTMVRDLNTLAHYRVLKLFQLDLFPATHHYETMALIQLKPATQTSAQH